jgi:hypothetical protein
MELSYWIECRLYDNRSNSSNVDKMAEDWKHDTKADNF